MNSGWVPDTMRILCVTPWFPAFPGAHSGNFILDSVNALEELGHRVKVLVVQPWHPGWAAWLHKDWGGPKLQPEAHSPSLALEQVRYLSVPRNHLLKLSNWTFRARVIPAIIRATQRFKPDVILAHTELVGLAGVECGKAQRVPVAVVLHGINTSARLNTPTQLNRVGMALASSDRVVLVGEPLVAYFAPIVGKTSHFRIVHNGFRLPMAEECADRAAWGCPLRFASVSNLHEGKGIDLNMQALGTLNQMGYSDWTYTVVGDGRERGSLQALAKDLRIDAQVRFVGAVRHDEVYGHLAQADVFALPSYREAFGVAYLEAMACGLLTIGVNGQGPAAFIRHGETGLLVEPKSVDSLVACFQEVLENQAKMQAIAARGQDVVRSEFTWRRHAEKMVGVLGEIATG